MADVEQQDSESEQGHGGGRFQVLPSLPSYGPEPERFSPTGLGAQAEGLVVRFWTAGGQSWVGNFKRGWGGRDRVFEAPTGRNLFVWAGDLAYLVDPETRACLLHVEEVADCFPLPEANAVVARLAWGFAAFNSSGKVWECGFGNGWKITATDGTTVSGWELDEWDDIQSFKLDLASGKVTRDGRDESGDETAAERAPSEPPRTPSAGPTRWGTAAESGRQGRRVKLEWRDVLNVVVIVAVLVAKQVSGRW